MVVILMGVTGAGKTTVGRALAEAAALEIRRRRRLPLRRQHCQKDERSNGKKPVDITPPVKEFSHS